jgi:hypothetical protein
MARRPAKTKAKVNPRRKEVPPDETTDGKPRAYSGSREDPGPSRLSPPGSSTSGHRGSLKPGLKHPPSSQLMGWLRSRPPVQ